MEGLADMFGADQWAGTGGVRNHTRNEFENLRVGNRISWVGLAGLIPATCANSFAFEPRSQRGFKFEWTDPDGGIWHVHGHEPDAGAAAGHVGGAGWVVRIKNGQDWLLSQTYTMVVPGSPNRNVDWSRSRGGAVAALSHIPFDP
jgi:hypothetical protein